MRPIRLKSRSGEYPAITDGTVVAFDHFEEKLNAPHRRYVLLQEHLQLVYGPYWMAADQWYVDLVHIQWHTPNFIELTDLYLDIIIDGDGPAYRLEDFDDLADALDKGQINTTALATALRGLQHFLTNRLHFGRDFPPSALRPFWVQPLPRPYDPLV
ncbi:MAG: hypothetical protein GKR89_06440 [Candidatus Latescibacteria bacterium]|nr:hypothetical protein [Candidatus Latescibacterota bacterium]